MPPEGASTAEREPAGEPVVWTWRRVPGRVARGLGVGSAVAAACFVMHVGGWGFLDRMTPLVALAGLAVSLPVALLVAFFAGGPALRAMARRGPLERGAVLRFGALVYGGVVFLWMLAVPVGPPPEIAAALGLSEPGPGTVAIVGLYRHALTPAVFALYGALATLAGWAAAFGAGRRQVALAPVTGRRG